MVKIRQAIVVEGKYDQNTLSQLVDATIFQTRGFGVMHDKALLSLLRRAAQTTGLIIFTDSDGAGFVIRNYLKGALPKDRVLARLYSRCDGQGKAQGRPRKRGQAGRGGDAPGSSSGRPCAERARPWKRTPAACPARPLQRQISTRRASPAARTAGQSGRPCCKNCIFRHI